MSTPRYRAEELVRFATALLDKTGLEADKSGEVDFRRQTEWIANACRTTPPRYGFDRVRLPGESGLRRREKQLKDGVELYSAILPSLQPWGEKLGVAVPAAVK